MLKRFIPILTIAFFTGLLFRLADQYGIALFRMFGTQGIAVIGILGARLLRSMQREDGVRRLEEQLNQLGEDVKVTLMGRIGALPFWMVDTPEGKIMLGASDIPHSMGQKRAVRQFYRHVQMMLDVARKEATLGSEHSLKTVLVLLRRGVPGQQKVEFGDDQEVILVNPEGLPGIVAARVA